MVVTADNAEMIVDRLAPLVAQADGRVLRMLGVDEPDILLIHPRTGLVAIDLDDEPLDPVDQSPFIALNTKVHTLRQTLNLDATVPIGRVVLFTQSSLEAPAVGVGGRVSLSLVQLETTDWIEAVTPNPLDAAIQSRITASLLPELTFTTTFRSHSHDAGADERARLRLTLDAQQALIAHRRDLHIAQLRGPPGSGKTLVLAARARWLASNHPDWLVRVLCYNKALLPHLQALTAGFPNITCSVFSAYARDLSVRFSFDDDSVSYDGLARALARGIDPIADALLIDEVQDFRAPWLAIARAGLTNDRGGLLMAGDAAQALYQENGPPKLLRDEGIEQLTLSKPYRTTRKILRAVGELSEAFALATVDDAPDGEPVELIWADTWDGQAKAIGREIQMMIESGDRQPREIAVLVTTWYGTVKRLQAELTQLGTPFTVIDKENQASFDRDENTVKVMTVHKAKGHEFPVVFLFGLERLPAFDPLDQESRQRARVAFVGFTRAMDQLLVTYTRDNDYLKILSSEDRHVRRWLWPDSYEGVEQDG